MFFQQNVPYHSVFISHIPWEGIDNSSNISDGIEGMELPCLKGSQGIADGKLHALVLLSLTCVSQQQGTEDTRLKLSLLDVGPVYKGMLLQPG